MNVLLPILLVILCCLTPMTRATAEGAPDGQTPIDLYIIAGQSNAAGYSALRRGQVRDKTLLNEGYANIHYIGDAQSTWEEDGAPYTHHHEIVWQPVKFGYGRDESCLGAEAGMAQTLSAYYNADTGREACIIKYAHGGTSLLDRITGENACEGNWMSPSYEATLTPISPGKLTGGLYRQLVAYVAQSADTLVSMGYAPQVRGLFWMQGEEDRYAPDVYRKAFAFFVSDLRRDLSEALHDDLSAMPVYVGEISRTLASDGEADIRMNERFIAMQNTLPETVPFVTVIPSSVFSVNPGGTDSWHFSGVDMLKMGNLVGEAIMKTLTQDGAAGAQE